MLIVKSDLQFIETMLVQVDTHIQKDDISELAFYSGKVWRSITTVDEF